MTTMRVAVVVALLAGCAAEPGPTATGGATTGADATTAETAAAETAGGSGADAAAVDDAVADAGTAAEVGAEISAPDLPPADTGPVACSEAELKACNDGLTCTADSCAVVGGKPLCVWKLDANACLIGGACQLKGDAKPANPCAQCLPEAATATWTSVADGTACDDGDLCTWQGKCDKKACVSVPLTCDDANPCTDDVCVPAKGCTYPVVVSKPCDDKDVCTKGEFCTPTGECKAAQSAVLPCNDNNPCTKDSCDMAKGCTATASTDPCSDGDACTANDACAAGACKPGAAANCDDGNTCTADVCDKAAGCYHLPFQSPCCTGQTSICDDGNPCTNDDCDAGTGGCKKSDNSAPCNDNNACTASDVCTAGKCAGAPKVCDDKSVCTADACDPAKGCVFSPQGSAACDDGNPCTNNDVCNAGVCKGAGQCACTPVFAPQAIKFTEVLIGSGGKPGEGIDLDDNPMTCAPSTNCSNGINNSLGALSGLANGALEKAVKEGSVGFLLEFKDFKQGPINLALYPAKLDPKNATCDATKATCNFLVDAKTIDPQQCKAVIALPGTLAGNLVNAGGKGSNFPITIPVQPGVNLLVTIYGARLVGTATLSGSNVTAFSGILSGSVPKASLIAAIDALPEEGLPLPKDALKSVLESAVETDMDSDGDGKLDAASIALKVKGGPGVIVGTY